MYVESQRGSGGSEVHFHSRSSSNKTKRTEYLAQHLLQVLHEDLRLWGSTGGSGLDLSVSEVLFAAPLQFLVSSFQTVLCITADCQNRVSNTDLFSSSSCSVLLLERPFRYSEPEPDLGLLKELRC